MARRSKQGSRAVSQADARKASPVRGRKRVKTKRRIFSQAQLRNPNSVADLEARLELQIQEAAELRQQQSATADILKVIASSPSDPQPVFEAIADHSNRLLGGHATAVYRFIGNNVHLEAFTSVSTEADAALKASYPRPISGESPFRTVKSGKLAQIADAYSEDVAAVTRSTARARGWRSIIFAPLTSDRDTIGAISVTRREPGSFAPHHVELLRTFADQAMIAIRNVGLFLEIQAKTQDLTVALQQQTATAEVLKVISRSAFDLNTVLETLISSAVELGGAKRGVIFLRDGDVFRFRAASYGDINPAWLKWLQENPHRASPHTLVGRAILLERTVCIPDFLADPEMKTGAAGNTIGGIRAGLAVPLLRDGKIEGVMALSRPAPGPFTDRQIELARTFADQAMIAIENTRLFNETKEALERQTATSDILKVIASSPSDVQPVFEAIAQRSNRLVNGLSTAVYSIVDDVQQLMSFTPVSPEADAALKTFFPAKLSTFIWGETIRKGKIYRIGDTETEIDDHAMKEMARLRGWRSLVLVPLLRDNEAIGLISITRKEPGSFAAHHVQLLQTFADQAVIAIENARLFNEVQVRTRDLQELLQQQTATSDVLKVISRSAFDLQAVFNTVARSALELCAADGCALFLREENILNARGVWGMDENLASLLRDNPVAINADSHMGRVVLTGRVANIADFANSDSKLRKFQDFRPFNSFLAVPLTREDQNVGVFTIYRDQAGGFTEREVELVNTFADQAAIAIENTRLFNETQEALERQTATANILKVIAGSPTDVQPVFEAIASSANRLLGGHSSAVMRVIDGVLHLAAFTPLNPQADNALISIFPMPTSATRFFERIERGEPYQEPDTEVAPLERGRQIARERGYRSSLIVPLMNAGQAIGAVSVTRVMPSAFTPEDVQLLQTFADQAVIALENARLFNETREALEQQTATSEVLQVISSSSGELDPVFNKMLENATRICGARFGTMTLYEDGGFRTVALYNAPKAYADTQLYKVIRPHPESGLSAAQKTREPVHIADIRKEPPYVEGNANVRALADLGGARTIIIVPMLRDNELVGTITIYRQEVKPFTEKQTEVVANFANQAVIAIENARLLNELRERTEELSRSLDNLRAAQDRLVQTEKLASLGQLTAGIAHEIKNPLNFVNNFSQLSAELVGEMTDVFENPALDEADRRRELDEIRGLLKSNLEKVVQHGKRADSIVKNMLLHSREGSGELRAADINGLVDESLNLAYHGARAEKSGFNITLQREFDASAGEAELFPQEITRALLNLISNGFYAATKRKAENGEASFEPTLSATTKNLGASVEIRIRDNGTGIPPEVKGKMFNPFFTTKPAGEGTGLGLSMTHDIIVKQHGGTIRVDTEPGAFTEFIITLHRGTGTRAA